MDIKDLIPILQQSRSYQLRPDARYLIVIESDARITVDHAIEIQEWLRSYEVDCVVLPVSCKLFQIEKGEKT